MFTDSKELRQGAVYLSIENKKDVKVLDVRLSVRASPAVPPPEVGTGRRRKEQASRPRRPTDDSCGEEQMTPSLRVGFAEADAVLRSVEVDRGR